MSTERMPKAIALGSASDTIALGVRTNESEDLSISERIWVADTLNDFMAGLNIGVPPLKDAQEDVSLVIQVEPMQSDLFRLSVWVLEEKSLSLSRFTGLTHRGRP